MESEGIDLHHDHPGLPSSAETWATIATHDAWSHEQAHPDRFDSLHEITQSFLSFGSEFSKQEIENAHIRRDAITRAYEEMFQRNGANVIVTPTLGCEAFHHGQSFPEVIGDTNIEMPWIDWAGFLYDANLTGMPACAIPMGIGDQGLPLSVQVMGRMGSDGEVLQVAQYLESLIQWQHGCLDPTLWE